MPLDFEFQSAFKIYKMNLKTTTLKTEIRCLLTFFIAALVLSGVTAIPIETELTSIIPLLAPDGEPAKLFTKVLEAVHITNRSHPFLMYGYDWLAFAHFVIAVAFIGPFLNPVKNIWVIEFGMIACVMIIPFALIVAGFRGLPVWWRLIDCSFGAIGFIPLWLCRKKILVLENLLATDRLNLIF